MDLWFGFALNNVDNTEMFLLLLSRACTEPRLFLLARKLGLQRKLRGRHSQDRQPKLTPGIFQTIDIILRISNWWKKEEGMVFGVVVGCM